MNQSDPSSVLFLLEDEEGRARMLGDEDAGR